MTTIQGEGRQMRRFVLSMVTAAAMVTVVGCGEDGGGELTEYGSISELVEVTTEASVEHETAHLTMTSSGSTVGGQNLEGQIRFGDQTELSMLSTGEGSGGIVMLEGIVYLDMGEEIVPGKPWVRIDPEGQGRGIGELLRIVARQMVRSSDPGQTLGDYADGAEITATAEEDVEGTPTIRYDIEVDFEKLADTVEDKLTEQLIRSSIAMGTTSASYSMWVDGRDLPLRFEIESPSPQGEMITSTVDYQSWGESVQIESPPAGQTADLSELPMPDLSGQPS